jgi:hypothetical protein
MKCKTTSTTSLLTFCQLFLPPDQSQRSRSLKEVYLPALHALWCLVVCFSHLAYLDATQMKGPEPLQRERV